MGCGSSSATTAVIATSNSNLKVNGQITAKHHSKNSVAEEKNQTEDSPILINKENVRTDQSSHLENPNNIQTDKKTEMFMQEREEGRSEITIQPGNQDKEKMADTTKEGTDSTEKSVAEDLDAKEKEKEKTKPLTEEEMKEKIQKTFEDAKHTWGPLHDKSLLVDAETGKINPTYRRISNNSFLYHFRLKGCPLNVQNKFKMDYYRLMVAEGAVTQFCDMVVYILKQGYENEDGTLDMVMCTPLLNSFGILTNFSDNEIERADILVDHPEFLGCLAEGLKKWTEPHLSGEKIGANRIKIVIGSPLSIIHNIAMQDKNIEKLHSQGFVDLLKPYLNSPIEKYRLSAVASLADIVNEQESEIIRTDEGVMKFLKNSLTRVMKEKNRRIFGWSPQELARTVKRIARNDANKRALVEQGVLPPLVKLAESEDVKEQREAVGAMWTLSFDKENQKDMVQDDEYKPVDTFIRLQHSPDKEVRKICNGALWTMRERLAESELYKDIGIKLMSPKQSPVHVPTNGLQEVKSEGHIMISYQWGHQNMLKKVRDGLRVNGFKVWMDIDDMEGSTLDAMARAVENAEIVLVCYSQKYKDSDNCRAEAEYAFQKKKKVIPLKMELNYKPDGWLGFICGAKLFFDFGGKYSFESRMEGLVKEISSKLSKDMVDSVIIPESASVVASAPVAQDLVVEPVYSTSPPAGGSQVSMTTVELVKKWKEQDVEKWMAKHSLSPQQLKKMTGVEIAFMMLLKSESPDFFYKVITDTLKITNLLTIAQFRFALDDTKL
ncbi:uncharacterized protein LOC117316559 [Pecten maximus]|uniref:uncharacterized protein LOC117316559 n=1 Tax=Pecten maximus TaxID=6579 RepID=UPI001458F8A4|nr:uncharacterized protein LOC117316559 [Pecten maximus]XP_033727095.1 uncharacterized protein LOC117316559 [Pecten maximus]XP_033727096.1 uncharacterized protein LOC117316559 [Pecten maximus]